MKAYDLNTSFTFGKYEGKTLDEVFQTDPAYVEKCMITVDDFAIDEKSIQKLFEKYPDTEFSDQAVDANLDKLDAMDGDDDEDFFEGEEVYSDDDYEDFDEEDLGKGGDDDDDDYGDVDDDLFGNDSLNDDWDDDDDDDYR